MKTVIGITGSRKITSIGTLQGILCGEIEIPCIPYGRDNTEFVVGDAEGVDKEAADFIKGFGYCPRIFSTRSQHPADLAIRSSLLVRWLKAARIRGDCTILLAVPNKPCPPNIQPARSWPSGDPSGTWKTCAMAKGNHVPVAVICNKSFIRRTWGLEWEEVALGVHTHREKQLSMF